MKTYRKDEIITFLKTKEEFGGLSNMAGGYPLLVNGVEIRTSEALYQACRFPHLPQVQRNILAQASPMSAKMQSRAQTQASRTDWNEVRVEIMDYCLRLKLAQNWQKFGELLLSTGDKSIVEISYKDQFWGVKPVGGDILIGDNVLGELLVALREKLQQPDTELLKVVEPLKIPNFNLYDRPIEVVGVNSVQVAFFPEDKLLCTEEKKPETVSTNSPIAMPLQIRKIDAEGFKVAHFDTLTGKSLDLETGLKNPIAAYLFPDATFSLGQVHEGSTEEQLRSFEDKTLAFANGEKFYFANRQVREEIFPQGSDGAAYGSIPFTDNQTLHELVGAKVLVIDDETGENGIGLDPEVAKRLVGDCYGRVAVDLHGALAEGDASRKDTPFQFRIGIRLQGESPARIAKGTLSPMMDLSTIGSGYDLVLPTSSFKGRKGQENQQIQPGEHTLTLALGVKTYAYCGDQSLGAQILVNYPRAVEAAIPLIEERLAELTKIAQDPKALAQDYLETVRKRYRFVAESGMDRRKILEDEEFAEALLDEMGDDFLENEATLLDLAAEMLNQERNYHLINTDLQNHAQLLEHPKVVDILNKHLQKQYRELATGRAIKFRSALLQPNLDLREDEFCDVNLPEGATVLVTRSPFLNSNNFIPLTNRHVPEVKQIKGSVFMNPTIAAAALQGDFDGDRVAYEIVPEEDKVKTNRDRFLVAFAEEIRQKLLPENRYAEVVKPKKVPYSGTFEAIALSVRENQIGLVANTVMKAIALEHETRMLPEEKKEEYVKGVVEYFKGAEKRELPKPLASLREPLNSLAQMALTDPVDDNLAKIANFCHQLVGSLSNQLQIAIDNRKSSVRPDQATLTEVREFLLNYAEVPWLDDYKHEEAYLTRTMQSGGYTPICNDLQTRTPRLSNKRLFGSDYLQIGAPSDSH